MYCYHIGTSICNVQEYKNVKSKKCRQSWGWLMTAGDQWHFLRIRQNHLMVNVINMKVSEQLNYQFCLHFSILLIVSIRYYLPQFALVVSFLVAGVFGDNPYAPPGTYKCLNHRNDIRICIFSYCKFLFLVQPHIIQPHTHLQSQFITQSLIT